MWRTMLVAQPESTVPVEGSWDQAPDYPNLTAAVKKAIANAREFLFKDFFGEEQVAQKR